MSSSQEDLEYIRRVAESGVTAPLLGGRYLMLWGFVITAGYGLHYALLTGAIAASPQAFGWVWGGVSALGIAGNIALGILDRRVRPGAGSIGNQAQRAVWLAAACGLAAAFAGMIVRAVMGVDGVPNFDWSIPLVFATYAVAQLTVGRIASDSFLSAAGVAALITVVGAIVLIGQPGAYLIAALGTVVAVLLPGVVQVMREPRGG
ncbi:MAG: hypothetical protein AAGF46_01060 [Pseudomonadota bacterium]